MNIKQDFEIWISKMFAKIEWCSIEVGAIHFFFFYDRNLEKNALTRVLCDLPSFEWHS